MMTSRLSDSEFAKVRSLAHAKWGIDINPSKVDMINGRLLKFIKNGGAASLPELVKTLEAGGGKDFELGVFDVLSTNMTSFFREKQHFDCLIEDIVKPIAASGKPGRLRLWSAACSKGCEPYSMAIALREFLPNFEEWDIKILASDLSRSVVAEARRGVYPDDHVESLSDEIVSRHFIKGTGSAAGYVKVHPALSKVITFGLVNLVGPWPHTGPFDAIFCRNVMIYFDATTRDSLVGRMQGMLRPNGLLILGCSEALGTPPPKLTRVQPAVYRAA